MMTSCTRTVPPASAARRAAGVLLAALLVSNAALAQDAVPSPNHPMHFGYYFTDGRYGDYSSEVNCYTNLYVSWARRGYECSADSPDSQWLPSMRDGLCRAGVEGRAIYLSLNLQEENPLRLTPLDAVLQAAAPVWSRVKYIELADEPNWTLAQTEEKIQLVRSRLAFFGLAAPPHGLGIVYADEPSDGLAYIGETQGIYANGLDWVGIEAYIQYGASPTPVETLTQQTQQWMARVEQQTNKNIVLVAMAYAPGASGGWENDIPTLVRLQMVPYDLARNDSRVLGITLFAYGRPRGTRQLSPIQAPHLEIGAAILGEPLPPGCGTIEGPPRPLCSPYDYLPPQCWTSLVSVGDASVSEGDSGTRSLTFPVTLSASANVIVSVDVASGGGTATEGVDYERLNTRVRFLPGETSKTVTVTVFGDTRDEPNESVLVSLSSVSGAIIGDGLGQGTIVDDDPMPSLSISGASVTEGDLGTVPAVFTVTLSAASEQEVRVGHRTADGTAVAPGDYLAGSGELRFVPGTTSQTVSVPVVGDEMAEPDETFFVDLFNPVNATISVARATGTILNDESAWKNVGTGDFNSDGKVDILWRHDNSGQLVVWFMDGTTRIGGTLTTPSSVADLNWRVRGTGDFNGDGKVDILWRHEISGQIVVWFMNGTTQTGGTFTSPPALSDLGWRLRGTGDFNRDGKVDILWQHETSGQLSVWFMDGTTRTGGTLTTPESAGDANWIATATGDFDRDGKVDILWRHRTSGQVVIWYMDGTVKRDGTFTTPPAVADLRWKLVGTGDFNSDGKVDIVWRHNQSGQNVVWLMDNATQQQGVFLESLY